MRSNAVLTVELACQEFDRTDGHSGKTSWPITITEEQVTDLMTIPAVWTPNQRKVDQLDGVAIWAILSPVLLVTVLKGWSKRKPWVHWLLQCFENDKDLKQTWELRMIWTDDPLEYEPVLELTDVVDPRWGIVYEPDCELLPGDLPNKEVIRQRRKDMWIGLRALDRIHAKLPEPDMYEDYIDDLYSVDEEKPMTKRHPLDYSPEEIDVLVSNLGQEDTLW